MTTKQTTPHLPKQQHIYPQNENAVPQIKPKDTAVAKRCNTAAKQMLPVNPPPKNAAAAAETTMQPNKQHCLCQNNNTPPQIEDTISQTKTALNKQCNAAARQTLPTNPSPK